MSVFAFTMTTEHGRQQRQRRQQQQQQDQQYKQQAEVTIVRTKSIMADPPPDKSTQVPAAAMSGSNQQGRQEQDSSRRDSQQQFQTQPLRPTMAAFSPSQQQSGYSRSVSGVAVHQQHAPMSAGQAAVSQSSLSRLNNGNSHDKRKGCSMDDADSLSGFDDLVIRSSKKQKTCHDPQGLDGLETETFTNTSSSIEKARKRMRAQFAFDEAEWEEKEANRKNKKSLFKLEHDKILLSKLEAEVRTLTKSIEERTHELNNTGFSCPASLQSAFVLTGQGYVEDTMELYHQGLRDGELEMEKREERNQGRASSLALHDDFVDPFKFCEAYHIPRDYKTLMKYPEADIVYLHSCMKKFGYAYYFLLSQDTHGMTTEDLVVELCQALAISDPSVPELTKEELKAATKKHFAGSR